MALPFGFGAIFALKADETGGNSFSRDAQFERGCERILDLFDAT